MKKIVICMDGLGGLPGVTFRALATMLEAAGFKVVYADTKGIMTHEDRIQRVRNAFEKEKSKLASGEQAKIYLLGQSAGGGAVREAAKLLEGDALLGGIILLSQAMPAWILFMTKPLLKSMLCQIHNLLLGREINTTPEQYRRVVEPLSKVELMKAVEARMPIPGREARTLAFCPPPLAKSYKVPMLVIWGSRDQWISPKAHNTLCSELEDRCDEPVTKFEVPGAGHLTLASSSGGEVINRIQRWIELQH